MAKKKHEGNGHADTTPPSAPVPSEAKKVGGPYTQSLPVTLQESELAVIRTDLTGATVARVGKEAEVGALREEIKGLKETEAKLVGKLERASEDRPVECQDWLLPDNRVLSVRLDDGQIVSERTAEADDLQEPMFDSDPEGLVDPDEGEEIELSEDRP